MNGILNIARWEWFKLVRRKMPWILLAIFFAFTQLAVWGPYLAYRTTASSGGRVMMPFTPGMGRPAQVSCNALRENPAGVVPAGTSQQVIDRMLQQCQVRMAATATRYGSFSTTGSISTALGIATSVGLILLGIISASTVGMDYGLGTLRPILARGTGRMSFLAGKYLMLIGMTTAALLVICAAAAGSGALVGQIVGPAPQGVSAAASLGDISLLFVKSLGAMVTYMTMASAVALLVRSTAAGMAISLAWYVAEGILVTLLTAAFDWFQQVADFLPMRNITALTSSGARDRLAALLGRTNDIDTLHASLVLAGWTLLFIVISAVVFRRRDVGSASGS